MNTFKYFAAPVVVAIVGACHYPAQAATTAGTPTVDLRSVTQNWDKVLPSEAGAGCPNWNTRFTCVMNNAAVRDNETGLVWTHPLAYLQSWTGAKEDCANLNVGSRKGWRLPSVTELASLIDMSNPAEPKLPANRPFIYQQKPGYPYWTSTSADQVPNLAPNVYVVYFPNGNVGTYMTVAPVVGHVWCVRGGQVEGSTH